MPISMTQNNQKYYLHYDQVGTLRAVSDSNHNIIKEITYDTFGNILSDTNQDFKVPFGFAGGLYDSDTKLTRFGYRDYDAYTGKWTAKDPIDFAGGDTNLYGYVLGDPVSFIDPEGLYGFDPLTGGPIDLSNQFYNWLIGYTKALYGGMAAVTVAGGMCMAAPPAYYLAMRNPALVYGGANALNDLLNPSMPASNPYTQGYQGLNSLWDLIDE